MLATHEKKYVLAGRKAVTTTDHTALAACGTLLVCFVNDVVSVAVVPRMFLEITRDKLTLDRLSEPWIDFATALLNPVANAPVPTEIAFPTWRVIEPSIAAELPRTDLPACRLMLPVMVTAVPTSFFPVVFATEPDITLPDPARLLLRLFVRPPPIADKPARNADFVIPRRNTPVKVDVPAEIDFAIWRVVTAAEVAEKALSALRVDLTSVPATVGIAAVSERL